MPRRAEVDQWFAKYENPMKELVLEIRKLILATDSRMDECIKWQAPTFTYQGNMASFFPRSKTHASLMFHQGAYIPGKHSRLEGSGDTSRVLKITSMADLRQATSAIRSIVRAWIAWKEEGLKSETQMKKKVKVRTKKASAKKPLSPRVSKTSGESRKVTKSKAKPAKKVAPKISKKTIKKISKKLNKTGGKKVAKKRTEKNNDRARVNERVIAKGDCGS